MLAADVEHDGVPCRQEAPGGANLGGDAVATAVSLALKALDFALGVSEAAEDEVLHGKGVRGCARITGPARENQGMYS